MWASANPINLIRYLIVCRINRPLVRVPRCLSTELSRVLGGIIASRLPTRDAHRWEKALAPWQEKRDPHQKHRVPEAAWPVSSVLFPYPLDKISYGAGEPIVWELKLMGEHADHGFFLEVILPALEAAATTTDSRWRKPKGIWGRFDVAAIYVARGMAWEPLIKEGRLDLNVTVTPGQWQEGLDFGAQAKQASGRLTWVTPFSLGEKSHRSQHKKIPHAEIPSLHDLLQALFERVQAVLPGKRNTVDDARHFLSAGEETSFMLVMEKMKDISVRHTKLKRAPKGWPGRWIGEQRFAAVPTVALPYLELASILHVGRQTHFGCGTFRFY